MDGRVGLNVIDSEDFEAFVSRADRKHHVSLGANSLLELHSLELSYMEWLAQHYELFLIGFRWLLIAKQAAASFLTRSYCKCQPSHPDTKLLQKKNILLPPSHSSPTSGTVIGLLCQLVYGRIHHIRV